MKAAFGNRYKVISKIGKGGMADVYKAEDAVLNRTVAVKVLHSQFAQEENFVARFRREAQAAAGLNHPNIVNIYDWGSEEDTYYIVMEYLAGRNLKEIIQERGPLPVEVAIDIASRVLSALHYAHKHEIIHRDIKPHNIIITADGDIKVTDFGIARAISATTTQTGSILGTAQYISPEQAKGELATVSSDVYSLGAVLYEMLVGRPPFEGDSPVSIALKQVHEAPMAPRAINPEIPETLERIVLKGLAKHPSDRYETAEEMQKDLFRFEKGLPVKSEAPLFEETAVIYPATKKPSKKKPLPWIPLGLALLLLVLIAGYCIFALLNTVAVLNVEGKTVEEAREILQENDLKLKVKGYESHESVEEGKIISQDPGPNERAARNSTVYVIVSKGKDLVKMPDLVGKSIEEATLVLSRTEFNVKIEKAFSDEVPPDTVMEQDPPAGELVPRDTTITLVISAGEETVLVPDLVGKTEQEAALLLEAAGLKMEKIEEFSTTVEAGKVIRQTPSPDREVKRDSKVTVVISKGAEDVTMPDVIGKTEAEAKAILQADPYNFTVGVQLAASGTPGLVAGQQPLSGAAVKRGSAVIVWVAP
ncbi:MAG: Stk1 family PASTA domain-containing Ser/Thr kinase [Candidatus Subteraquimicrobiales bacterium]|nr:Stk1 family PASTA domain-containing Ser/Thr kinase [Candidatus Subteraquimicrobiales bacterium]